ncbi:hypothetical protein GQ602_005941 [Ophiocordyceps camponoti-floridani]|uniref:Uncharacterized protein n=1 Tax=Ophiocordyceps camponoti-floridani TaxID=2030778 RepID=A0A8H4Q290_9HYPO|nr:hypothetical protein GQ602_005941 [Ophiocordyceps camponoti-floridani]
MSFSPDPDDVSGFISLGHCFEMEFLVAKKRPDVIYSDDDEEQDEDSDESSLCQLRWFCPPEAVDPELEVLQQCQEILSKNQQSAEIVRPADAASIMPWEGSDASSWIVQPARFAVAQAGSHRDYDWIGVRLRSPLLRPWEVEDGETDLRLCIGALRMTLLMHVNSTCPFDVLVRAKDMTLTHVKKMVTLVWLFERDMLLNLRPDLTDDTPGRLQPVTIHSMLATRPLEGVDNSRPQPQAFAEAMERHVPRLLDDAMQEHLQRVWACPTLDELASALGSSDGQPLAFSLHTCPDDEPEEPAFSMIAAFRYALWHPYDHVDVSECWVELAHTICQVMIVDSRQFKRSNRRVDQMIDGFRQSSNNRRERWMRLAERLSLPVEMNRWWDEVVQQYESHGRLTQRKLDRQPALGQIPELSMYRSR